MKVTVLIENSAPRGLKKEWGLSFYVEHEGKSWLVDTGASSRFISNADRLGIDITGAEALLLSHAHYDHGRGIGRFLKHNPGSGVVTADGAAENCYSARRFCKVYIGLKRGILKECGSRLKRADRLTCVSKDVWVLPHYLQPSAGSGRLLIKENGRYVPDTFRHEQSIIFRTQSGLVVISPCSHLGVDRIVTEIRESFDNEHICAFIGGLHLFRSSAEHIRAVAGQTAAYGIEKLYIGHCTGAQAVEIFKEVLGDSVNELTTGQVIEINET